MPEPKEDEVLMKVGGAGVCGSDTMFLGKDDEEYTHFVGHCRFR
jgi:Zn-dependent alcohol dehydrogenase